MSTLPTTRIAGYWAKIDRADELALQLKTEMERWLRSEPKPYRIVGEHHNDYREYGFTAFGTPVPLRFSVLVGEIVHHLRSSLDHVVWALASKHLGTPNNRVQFPICETEAEFKKAEQQGALKGVGHQAFAYIRSIQPFTSATPRDTILYVLHKLDIQDKHKLLLLTNAAVRLGDEITVGDTPGMPPRERPCEIVGMSMPEFVPFTDKGSRVFTIHFADATPEIRADANFEVTIVFEKLGSAQNIKVIDVLTLIRHGVFNTIKALSPIIE